MSPFAGSGVLFSSDRRHKHFEDIWRFLIALFTDNQRVLDDPLTVSFQHKYSYFTSVLWTLRLEFRASFIIFLLAVVVKAVPPKSRWLLYASAIWFYNNENYFYLLFVLGMLLCDLEQTYAPLIKRLLASKHYGVVGGLWCLRLALGYAWMAASWW